MRTPILLLAMSAIFAVASHHAGAQSSEGGADRPVRLEEGYGDAFVNYQPLLRPEKPTSLPPAAKTDATPAPSPASAPPAKEQVDVAWLRKNYALLEERAINNPGDEDAVSAYLYVKRIVLDKAQRFSDAVMRVTNADPLINENNRIPYASAGAQSIQNANYLAQGQAVREMAKVGGLLVFVDGACRFCATQLPVVGMLSKTYGLEYLVISTDGSRPKNFGEKLLTDNGLFGKLGLKLTPSIVYVPNPKAYASGQDLNHYLVVSQGFYAASELTKQLAYAGHQTKLLSDATMRDLDVWSRGVASIDDLSHLQLDPNKPQEIKAALQPILQRRY